jgi:hypothetical protein
MPLWAWLFFVVSITYSALVLWRAWDKRYFRYGPIIYSLEETPGYFWFFAVVFAVGEVFLIVFFSVIVVSAIWGPVFHQ